MKHITKGLATRYKEFLADPSLVISVVVALIFLLLSLVVNYFANQYAYVSRSNSITDIFLDNLPVVRMDEAFVVSTIIFIVLIFFLLLAQPRKVSFVIKSVALFVVMRSIFMSLTHIAPSPLNTLSAPSEIGRAFSSGADLFFSGHTGMPYLFALMYWYNKHLRIFFLTCSIVAGIAVLLGHIHYSIDVASAYFITYGIYIIARRWFAKDLHSFNK